MKTWYIHTIGFYSAVKYKTMKLAGKSIVLERQKTHVLFPMQTLAWFVCVVGCTGIHVGKTSNATKETKT